MNPSRFLLPVVWIAALASPGSAAETPEAAALAVLASGAGLHEKARACQELAVVGGPAAVPALAALLNQEHLADYARSGLEGIKDSSAGAALRKALPGLNGRYLSGAVNSLGVRREVAAVPDLQRLAVDAKRGVGAEALASLGMIASPEALKTLQKVLADGPADLRVPAAHAAIMAAAQLAKDGNPGAARGVLDSVVRALPDGSVRTVAKNQIAALGAKASTAKSK